MREQERAKETEGHLEVSVIGAFSEFDGVRGCTTAN